MYLTFFGESDLLVGKLLTFLMPTVVDFSGIFDGVGTFGDKYKACVSSRGGFETKRGRSPIGDKDTGILKCKRIHISKGALLEIRISHFSCAQLWTPSSFEQNDLDSK